ncbi:hypothetical protein B0H13DRAFT_1904238 [Mycena leptocephala]|nr:hypothetical protein B0H13DRAFT_1904238 [Mycena leptocephala]
MPGPTHGDSASHLPSRPTHVAHCHIETSAAERLEAVYTNPGTHYHRWKERSPAKRSAGAREAWREQSVEDTSPAQTCREERVEEARWVQGSKIGRDARAREDGEPGAGCSSESRTTRLRWAQRTGSGGNVAKARNVVIYARGQSAGARMAMDGVLCVLTQIRGDGASGE